MDYVLSLSGWSFIALLAAVAIIDIRTHTIESRLIFVMLGLAAIKIIIEIVSYEFYLTNLWIALISSAVTLIIFWGLYRFTNGIGLGDVKLMAVTALFYGMKGIFSIVVFSMLFAGAAGVILIIQDRRNLKRELPFAPFVAAAALLRELIVFADRG